MMQIPVSDTFPRIAVVGGGYWGKNLIRNFYQLGALQTICDSREPVLNALLQGVCPGVKPYTSYEALLEDERVDAVVLATPSLTHYTLGMQALEAGKHVYIEKPLATTLADAQALVEKAQEARRTLMVGHLLMYHPAINRMKQLLDAGTLGNIRYIQSDRLNYNLGRNDRNALWDLAPHDLSVLLYFMNGAMPDVRFATGSCAHPTDAKTDTVQVSLQFANGVIGHLQTSWIYPRKQVQLMVVGTQGALLLDDTLPLDRRLLHVRYTPAGERLETPVDYLPLEPLRLECQHFLNALQGEWKPQSDERNGLAVVQLLEAIQFKLDEAARICK
jgi:UDP-2-acetamido-3-amino-2,3-dideoxy-glucuronate N-acetyltransferase